MVVWGLPLWAPPPQAVASAVPTVLAAPRVLLVQRLFRPASQAAGYPFVLLPLSTSRKDLLFRERPLHKDVDSTTCFNRCQRPLTAPYQLAQQKIVTQRGIALPPLRPCA